ncbi:MAG: sensor domain-containing diguanylate cyclase [Deltaproteobacteria bacterium]|nr:sensor domain-containing diguanylate cyclase [Deltaproteobacteria bacterium]
MRINIAPKQILDKILERKRRDEYRPENIDLKAMLKEILTLAGKFVPSESGSILLDDPVLNQNRQKPGVLYFVSCFGKGSSFLVGTYLPAALGIAGQTYTTGRPYISRKAKDDVNFYPVIDKKTNFVTKSIICAPIRIKKTTIGVIELLNRVDGSDYTGDDLTLLKLFAEYTSTLIQNSLDAKRFGELSIKDNLTGLYNDRFLYGRLTKDVARALKRGSDLSLIFLDLDNFKEVNDVHGHLAGSQVLTEAGSILLDSLTIKNSAAIRYGGDEFVVILPDTGVEEAAGYAEDLREAIARFVFLKHRKHRYPGGEKALNIKGRITCSIGVASIRANSGPANNGPNGVNEVRDDLIKKADSAMYASKQTGRNKVSLAK